MDLTNKSTVGFLGFIGGAVLTLTLTLLTRASHTPPGEELLARVGEETLTRKSLMQRIAPEIIPVENDEYRILKQGVDEWLTDRLIEMEAKARGVGIEGLYQKEIWSKVQVSYGDISEYYSKNRELFGAPFEQVSYQIGQELRRKEYARLKALYLAELEKKHRAKIYLKMPGSFVEGLALPTPTGGVMAGAMPLPFRENSGMGSPPSRGSDTAPVTLMDFSDFHCPFCKKVIPTMQQIMQNYPGKVRWVFRHYPLSATPGAGSFLTHEASVCAQEQGKFWEFHDEVYQREVPPGESDQYAIAEKIGLDQSKFRECLGSGRYQNFLKQELGEGGKKGVQGTPTVFVNDKTVAGAYPYEHFVKVIEGVLNPGKNPPPTAPALEAPPPSPMEAVKFDDLEGRPSLGPKKAPITLVEFSDFHCPFCKRVTPTLEELVKNYPGKVRRVWRHYPLAMHAGADRTHEASECANEQGKFWEYHDKLFEAQGSLWDNAALTAIAISVGADQKKFEQCLTGRKYKELIQKEVSRGNQVGVQGTPAVFVNGKLVSGAQPYESFDQIVKGELSKS